VTHKLLLADDSVTIQRVVELTFSGEDVHVVTVGDGEQAIARIPVERPDIVLADIAMPKRSGYDVAAFVKGRPDLAHIPVLLLAGAFEPVDEARAQQVKCDGVLVKPFEPQQVISRVRELVEGAKGRAQQPVALPAPPAVVPEPRIPSPESRMPSPEPPLDDYFERLDAAFAGLGGEPAEPTPLPPEIDDFRAVDVPTVEKLLGSTLLHEAPGEGPLAHMPLVASAVRSSVLDIVTPPGGAGESADAVPAGGRNPIADIFTALFALEQGEPGAAPVRLPAPQPAPVVVTAELVEEVTRRVIERLAPDTARELVRQIVSEVAERLIRDEIARIKSAVGTRQ